MNAIKCKNCGLSNFATDTECRRCGYSFVFKPTYTEKRPSRFSLLSLFPIVLILGLVYYFYSGVQGTMNEINANDAKRVQSEPAERPVVPGQSRTEYDRSKASRYGNLVSNSSSLNAHQKHIDQTQKAMQQASNSSAR